MDSKTLIKALKTAVREVIKEELTEILREGLQSTITEIKQPQTKRQTTPAEAAPKRKTVQFSENRWASVLNETEPIQEQMPTAMNSFADIMNEGMDEIRMTSADAKGFGVMRENMKAAITGQSVAPKIMEDPETGKTFEVPQEIQQVLTRDYSSLMTAINKKKGR
jgi:exoribonuclease R